MAKTPLSPSTNDDAAETAAVGKGRATPTRAQQEAARRRPLVANTKEAKAAARAEMQIARQRARIGMEAGEDKYLPVRDKGPQRLWVRNYVDSRWWMAEWIMALMVVVIIASMWPAAATYAFLGLWAYIILVIGEMVLLSRRIKRKAADKFGLERREKGLGWYAAMRSMQMRFMRLPKPQVKRGERTA